MERTGLWDIKGSEGYIYAAFKNQSDEGISWFGRAVMPSCLGMRPPKAAFFSFRMQSIFQCSDILPTEMEYWIEGVVLL